jgi:hypothetical protein
VAQEEERHTLILWEELVEHLLQVALAQPFQAEAVLEAVAVELLALALQVMLVELAALLVVVAVVAVEAQLPERVVMAVKAA